MLLQDCRLMLLLYEYGTTHKLGFQLVDKEMWVVDAKVFLNGTNFLISHIKKFYFFSQKLSPSVWQVRFLLNKLKLFVLPYISPPSPLSSSLNLSVTCGLLQHFPPFVNYSSTFFLILSKLQPARPETCCPRC